MILGVPGKRKNDRLTERRIRPFRARARAREITATVVLARAFIDAGLILVFCVLDALLQLICVIGFVVHQLARLHTAESYSSLQSDMHPAQVKIADVARKDNGSAGSGSV